jgi:hypothetical protein
VEQPKMKSGLAGAFPLHWKFPTSRPEWSATDPFLFTSVVTHLQNNALTWIAPDSCFKYYQEYQVFRFDSAEWKF